MGRAARPLYDPANHGSIKRRSDLLAARRGSLRKPARPAGEREDTAALTPSHGTRSAPRRPSMALVPENQVRTGLPVGGKWIRTFGPSQGMSQIRTVSAERDIGRRKRRFLYGGTDGSHPVPSSGESVSSERVSDRGPLRKESGRVLYVEERSIRFTTSRV